VPQTAQSLGPAISTNNNPIPRHAHPSIATSNLLNWLGLNSSSVGTSIARVAWEFVESQLRITSTVSVEVKVKLSLCFNWAPRHEGVLGEWRYNSTHSLTSSLDEGEWSASRPGHFTPRERPPGTHWIGGWVGPRAVLDAVVKRKIPSPRRESSPRTPIVQSVAQRYTDWAITAHIWELIKFENQVFRLI
jgi:hypothetical protein